MAQPGTAIATHIFIPHIEKASGPIPDFVFDLRFDMERISAFSMV